VGSELIEYRSQLGARKNLQALLRLAPRKARVQRENGFDEIDAAGLTPDDTVQVRPGERIPGDGTVLDGVSTVDQSAITGESIPVEIRPGADVFGGTINQTGVLLVRITAQVQDSTLAKIQALIARAEENQTPVMRLMNRYVSWYTPIILMCAAIVLFFTRDIDRAIAMLIVACPCTIILSTPTAFVAALSAAARVGVIIKDLKSLEVAKRVDMLMFDKTGTLTTGRLTVAGVSVNGQVDESQLLAMGASLDQYSTHPVAKAVVYEANRRRLSLSEATEVVESPGYGMEGRIDGRPVLIGRKEWVEKQCRHTFKPEWNEDGTTGLYVARDRCIVGVLHLADTLRPDARQVIDSLRKESARQVIMLTGDGKKAAGRIARELSCEVESEVMPGEKMDRVEAAKERGGVVCVVGDGVNDGPALAAGDISIAMGAAGSDVAIHSAGIVLMNENLNRIPFVLELSRRAVDTIRQNLMFSTIYVLTLICLSALGVLSPVWAAILHSASSLFVVFNSARLLRVGEELA
jgi:Cd2+/Zn2+-exporting ATPase